MHVLAICHLHITTIIIIYTYKPLYIFHLSIIHIPNSTEKILTAWQYNLENPIICKYMHYFIPYN